MKFVLGTQIKFSHPLPVINGGSLTFPPPTLALTSRLNADYGIEVLHERLPSPVTIGDMYGHGLNTAGLHHLIQCGGGTGSS